MVFPADRDALLAEARENQASEAVLNALRSLPAAVAFATVGEAWVALTDRETGVDPEARRARAAADPVHGADR